MLAGKRVVDIGPLLSIFEAQEGEVQHIIGKTGMGKTYEATRRALLFLYEGYTVYTTWRLNLPDYYDEREHFWPVFRNIILGRKNFFRFDFKHNWHFVDLRKYEVNGIVDTEALAKYLATRTDCIFFMDEGQDVFDSHKKAGAIARQSITRTRHMHKTLIIISQRAQAVDVTARGNVTYFYKCEKRKFWFLPAYFKVYRTEEIDEVSSYPLWTRSNSVGELTWQAPVYYAAFARKRIYEAYDSWYMRQEMIRSQDIKFEAYTLNTFEKIGLLFTKRKKAPVMVKAPTSGTGIIPVVDSLPQVAPSPMVEYITKEVHYKSQGVHIPIYKPKIKVQ